MTNTTKLADEPPKIADDFGLNYEAEYTLPRFMVWVRSNYHEWPTGIAGFDNQPADLADDFMTLLTRLDHHIYNILKDKQST